MSVQRCISGRAMELISVDTSPCWRSATVACFQSSTQVSSVPVFSVVWTTVVHCAHEANSVVCSDWSPRWVASASVVMQQRRRVRPQLVRDGDRSRADIEKNEVRARLRSLLRPVPNVSVALERVVFHIPELSLQRLDPWKRVAFRGVTREEDGYHHFLKPARSRMLVGVHKRNIHLCFSAYVPKDAQHTLNGFSSCVESLRLPSEQASSALSGVFRRS